MAADSLYARYKRDTRHMLYWLIRASNDLIQSRTDGSAHLCLNTDGEGTVAGILEMARLVGRHIKQSDIPYTVFWLLRAVIRARAIHHQDFLPVDGYGSELDADVKKSNARHWAFIEALSEALEALGGSAELSEHGNMSEHTQKSMEDSLEDLVRSASVMITLLIRALTIQSSRLRRYKSGPGKLKRVTRETSGRRRDSRKRQLSGKLISGIVA